MDNEDIEAINVSNVLNRAIENATYKKAVSYAQEKLSMENLRSHIDIVCTTGKQTTICENIENGSCYDISNTCRFLIQRMDHFWCDDRYSFIIQCYNDMTDSYQKLCDLSIFPDYQKEIKDCIAAYNEYGAESRKYKILGDKRKFFLNPKKFPAFLESLFIEAFQKGAIYWRKELKYSKNTYELIKKMDAIIAMNIPYLEKLASDQKDIYLQLLEKEG